MKAGYIENGAKYETPQGSGQGSVISPLLANIALHGMEEELGVTYKKIVKQGKEQYFVNGKCVVIRYADDSLKSTSEGYLRRKSRVSCPRYHVGSCLWRTLP